MCCVLKPGITSMHVCKSCYTAIESYMNNDVLPHCRAIEVDLKPFVRVEVEAVGVLKQQHASDVTSGQGQ